MLHQRPLMLKRVPLAQVVQIMVKMLVNLPAGPILDQQSPQHPQASHPQHLTRHPRILGPLPLSETSVSPDAPRGGQLARLGAGVHGHGLTDDETVGHELADGLAGVGVADFVDFVGVKPDLALAAAYDGGGEALLGAKVDPACVGLSVCGI